jgi:hypothetical protein
MRKPKKIDIFYNGHYLCSTMWASSCKEAKSQFLTSMKNNPKSYIPMFTCCLSKGYTGTMEFFDQNNLKCYFSR